MSGPTLINHCDHCMPVIMHPITIIILLAPLPPVPDSTTLNFMLRTRRGVQKTLARKLPCRFPSLTVYYYIRPFISLRILWRSYKLILQTSQCPSEAHLDLDTDQQVYNECSFEFQILQSHTWILFQYY